MTVSSRLKERQLKAFGDNASAVCDTQSNNDFTDHLTIGVGAQSTLGGI